MGHPCFDIFWKLVNRSLQYVYFYEISSKDHLKLKWIFRDFDLTTSIQVQFKWSANITLSNLIVKSSYVEQLKVQYLTKSSNLMKNEFKCNIIVF